MCTCKPPRVQKCFNKTKQLLLFCYLLHFKKTQNNEGWADFRKPFMVLDILAAREVMLPPVC